MDHINTRLLDASEESLNALAPLRGYCKQPLVSLEKAVENLGNLVDDIDSRVWTATNISQHSADKLSEAESAAIILYTMEWDPDNRSFYGVLNQTLRLEDRRTLIPWFPYLKLILTALFKLPSVRCTVWRGARADLRSKYKLGAEITWWAFSSCTSSINVFEEEQYLGTSGPRTLFTIECLNGKDIKHHSYFEQEVEILLLPCTRLQVIGHLSSKDGLNIIHLREISPPVMLLEPPNPIERDPRSCPIPDDPLSLKLEKVMEENKSLKEQCNRQETHIKTLEAENQQLRDKCANHIKKIETLDMENQKLRKEVTQYTQPVQQLEDKNNQLENELENAKKQIEEMIEKIKSLEQKLDRQTISSDASPVIRPEEISVASGSTTRTQEFAPPCPFQPKLCKGRLCAKCGNCRDWYFTGDQETWHWIRNCKNWNKNDLERWRNDRVWERFKRRDGATCIDRLGPSDLSSHCLCADNYIN